MDEAETARDAAQRVSDTRARLLSDHDLWIATTSADGAPWLAPLAFHWSGEELLMATLRSSQTYRNVADGSSARIALGDTRDVVMLDGTVTLPEQIPEHLAVVIAYATGHDPRADTEAGYLQFVATRVHAWRNDAELDDATIMRDGAWVVPG